MASTQTQNSGTADGTTKADENMSAGKFRSMGEEAMAEHRYNDAVEHYRKAILMEPDNATNYFKLFRVHQRMKQLAEALVDMNKALELKADNTEYRRQRLVLLVMKPHVLHSCFCRSHRLCA